MSEPQKGRGSIGVDSRRFIPHVLFRRELTNAFRAKGYVVDGSEVSKAKAVFINARRRKTPKPV